MRFQMVLQFYFWSCSVHLFASAYIVLEEYALKGRNALMLCFEKDFQIVFKAINIYNEIISRNT